MDPATILTILGIAMDLVNLAKAGVAVEPQAGKLVALIRPHLDAIAASHPSEHAQALALANRFAPAQGESPVVAREEDVLPDP